MDLALTSASSGLRGQQWFVVVLLVATLVALSSTSLAPAGLSPSAARTAAVRSAWIHWDNPLQQMIYRTYVVLAETRDPNGPLCDDPSTLRGQRGVEHVVGAYSFFGIEVARARVSCSGSVFSWP